MNPIRAAIPVFAPVVLIAAALILALPGILAEGDALRAVANLAALTALGSLPFLFLLGTKNPLAVQAMGLPRVFRLHRLLGLFFPALLLTHAGLHVRRFAAAMDLSLTDAALAMPNTWEMVLGKAALVLFLAAWGAALLGTAGRLPRRVWRPAHLTVHLAAPAAFIHALFRGEDMTRGWLFAAWSMAAAAWLATAGWRAMRTRRGG